MSFNIPRWMRFAPLAATALFLALLATASTQAQTIGTFYGSIGRAGIQNKETVLTPASVDSASFGKVATYTVDGDVYAEPLYLTNLRLKDGTVHNVLYVATAHDWVYAFDADGKNPASGYLWRKSLLGAGETWLTNNDVNSSDITPAIGIIGTPTIDLNHGVIFVVSKSKTATGSLQAVQRLHALALADGTEKLNGPTLIQASASGSGDGVSTVSFNPLLNNQRSALLLTLTPGTTATSSVFICWSSHGDQGRYRGWVISYNSADISKQTGAWVDTPNDSGGGIWMSAGGLSSDGNGDIFAAIGNGAFDANTGGPDYGDSLVRLKASSSGLPLADYFTPLDQFSLAARDADFGTAQPLILPGGISRTVAHLMMTVDKAGTIYLLNRDHLGGYNTNANQDVQDWSDGGFSIHSNLVFFNDKVYLAADGAPLQAWSYSPTTGKFNTAPSMQSVHTFGCNQCDGSGSNFQISANGTANGIVWAIDYSNFGTGAAVLYAFDAANLGNNLYSSAQAANARDQGPVAVKFTTPTVANGHVYVGGRNAVVEYGLLSKGAALAQ